VDRGRDQDDVLACRQQRFELTFSAQQRIHELPLDHLIAIEMFQRRGIRDEHGEKRPPE
jgi:hypothetical protein